MSTSTRQTNLLVAEDWKKIYQTFREADFQSYDFETLRKTMIDYLRLYYPEDFNDFIESSEYIALIDLIAFMGQALSFRTDMNARENFLDTAERRDSILKLARLVSYNPKRNTAASGYLKIESITTSESLSDSTGFGLAGVPVTWNDPTNANWSEQFNTILNAALVNSQVVGKSGNSQTINGTAIEEYAINILTNVLPAFKFSSTVNDSTVEFEAVSATSLGQSYIYEVPPIPTGKFNILKMNDGRGNSSNNTGFFVYFKQGGLATTNFSLAETIPNQVVNVNFDNINNSDVWLYNVNTTPVEWKKVPAVAGINVIYNNLADKNLFQINSRAGDQVDLVFGDGSFANIPRGAFKIYYRQSNGRSYKIVPDEIQNVPIVINYVARGGRVETLTLRVSLHYTVSNALAAESLDEIRQKAPQQYYTQGRMITGEDYNIVPFTQYSNILKVKSVNRTSSGISRFLDVIDTSGKYSSTNIFADDGHLYRENILPKLNFTMSSTTSIQKIVQNDVQTILSSKEMRHFYYANIIRTSMSNIGWSLSDVTTNGCTGFLYNTATPTTPIQVGYVTSSTAKHIRVGAILKFSAPTGQYFNSQNQLKTGVPAITGDKKYLYVSVMQVVGDGTNGGLGNFANGTGPITLNQKIPAGALLIEVIPVFKNSLPSDLVTDMVARIAALTTFALRYESTAETWYVVEPENIGTGEFDPTLISSAGNNSRTHADNSWLLKFEYSSSLGYTLTHRGLNYIFQSTAETKFYFDNNLKVFDSKTGLTINDQIKILKINTAPDSNAPIGIEYVWHIYKNIVESDGYEQQSKVLLTYPDTNNDGIPDNPDLFEILVQPNTNPSNKLVFFKVTAGYGSFVDFIPLNPETVVTDYTTLSDLSINLNQYIDGQLVYLTTDKTFYVITVSSTGVRTAVQSISYLALTGRSNLYFQYCHNSPNYRRIDPSPNNIIDVFVLTKTYESDYRKWIQDSTNKLLEPVPATTEELKLEYGQLNDVKTISDTIVFNSAKYKLLFGPKADAALRATFKIVKNPLVNVSDNDIKSSVISAINDYFSIENWDFGETFYFSELSAYLHTALSPNVSSIIIVPANLSTQFGNLYQINAEANEIVASCATVDNIDIISAITAANINMAITSTTV